MNTFIIAKKEIISAFRDKRTLAFMLAFPIVLIMILGTALTNAFDHEVSVGKIHVLYKDKSDGEFSQGFKTFAKEAKTSGVYFEKVLSDMDAKTEVKKGHYDAYLEVTGSGMKFYKMEKNSVKNSIIQGMLTAFANRYHAVAEIVKVSPKQAGEAFVNSSHDDYIKETSLNSDKKPGSMDYYAVTMTTLIALYSAIHASYLIRGERLRKTADRLVAAPVHKAEIFAGKLIGGLGANLLCILIVIAVSMFLFKANWGEHLWLVLVVVLTVVLFAVSFGLGISYLTNTGEAGVATINVLIPLVAFFGGAYFPVEDVQGALVVIKDLSPLTWTNEAIIKIIYTNDLAAGWPAISLNVGLSVLFLLIAVVSMRRREGL
ncbi:ABC transporter permease [Bacillus sp. z60-18]|uniref:ABC transporter permease n=1 Tax=unclassified Bacillus (in: firmicutes) TaxID=185979 RepID=UPI00240A8142|nr:ABC transporter permease [Bacillus sp. HSf4]WFA04979.1 ABC transporter permease [Bacillus sp. HSf4]